MSSEESQQMEEPSEALITDTEPAIDLETKTEISPNNGVNSVDGDEDNDKNDGTSGRVLKPEGRVGVDTLAEQFVNRLIRDGFAFNIMAIGSTGVGKSTLLESLFKREFPDISTRSGHNLSAVDVTAHTYDLQERNIRLKLGLIESKGFGDQMDKTESFKPFFAYIDHQFEAYLQEELKVHRNKSPVNDTRIHVCIYLISPVGNGLRAIDVLTMKELDTKTNLVPVIAKSDTITEQELDRLKARIMSQIVTNGINVYHSPTDDSDVEEINSKYNSLMPFAIVASNQFVRVGSKQMRARQYPWGTVQVENENHSDFVRLRDMILRVNMEDLRETTHSRHYEKFRRNRLEKIGFRDIPNTPFEETYETLRATHLSEMALKEEEIRQRFLLRVKQKEAELKEAENELFLRFDRLKKESSDEKKRLERDNQKLDDDIRAFNFRKASILGGTASGSNLTLQPTLSDKKKKK